MFLLLVSAFIGAACALPFAWYAAEASALLFVPLVGSIFALFAAAFNHNRHGSGRGVGAARRVPHPDVVWC